MNSTNKIFALVISVLLALPALGQETKDISNYSMRSQYIV